MRCKLFACEVLRKEIEALCHPADFDAEFLEMGLHDQPEKLNAELARRLARLRGQPYDAILLAFGLCSNGTANLAAPGIPLVVARAHDCVTIFLGSRKRYMEEHKREAGTYWFARGFLDRADGGGGGSGLWGLTGSASVMGEDGAYSPQRREAIRQEFVEKYGEDNADFLMEELVDAWKKNYRRAVLVAWDGDENLAKHRDQVQTLATENHWTYEETPTNHRLLEGLLNGAWQTSDDYAVTPPEGRLRPSHDEQVMTGVGAE